MEPKLVYNVTVSVTVQVDLGVERGDAWKATTEANAFVFKAVSDAAAYDPPEHITILFAKPGDPIPVYVEDRD